MKKTLLALLVLLAGIYSFAAEAAKEKDELTPFRQTLADYHAGKIGGDKLCQSFEDLKKLGSDREKPLAEQQEKTREKLFLYAMATAGENTELQNCVKALWPDSQTASLMPLYFPLSGYLRKVYAFFSNDDKFLRLNMEFICANLEYRVALYKYFYVFGGEDKARLYDDFNDAYYEVRLKKLLAENPQSEAAKSPVFHFAMAQADKCRPDSGNEEIIFTLKRGSDIFGKEIEKQSEAYKDICRKVQRATALLSCRRTEIILSNFGIFRQTVQNILAEGNQANINDFVQIMLNDEEYIRLQNELTGYEKIKNDLCNQLLKEGKLPAAKEFKIFKDTLEQKLK